MRAAGYFSSFNGSYVCFLMPSPLPSSFFKLSADVLYIETQHRQFSGPDNITISVREESSFSTPVGFLRPRNPFFLFKSTSYRNLVVLVLSSFSILAVRDAFDEALLAHGDKTRPEIKKKTITIG